MQELNAYFMKQWPYMIQLGFAEKNQSALLKYVHNLWDANTELNLFSRKMLFEEFIDNHIIDCLLPLKNLTTLVTENKINAIADLGSGGGLPALIWALHFPNIEFYLFEKSPKKTAFLEKQQHFIKNIQIKSEITKDLQGIQLITARAFKPLDVILEMTHSYYQKKGLYFLLKGRKEKIQEEFSLCQKKFKHLGLQISPLLSPVLEVERHLVLINT